MLKKILSLILIICLCFTLVTVPMRSEANAIVQALPVVVGITGLIMIMMGLQFASLGAFREAAQACAIEMPTELITVITTFVTFAGDVSSPTFGLDIASGLAEHWDDIYAFVKGYFGESGTISLSPTDDIASVAPASGVFSTSLVPISASYGVYYDLKEMPDFSNYKPISIDLPSDGTVGIRSFRFRTIDYYETEYVLSGNISGWRGMCVNLYNSDGSRVSSNSTPLGYYDSNDVFYIIPLNIEGHGLIYGLFYKSSSSSGYSWHNLSSSYDSCMGRVSEFVTGGVDLPYSTAPGAVPPDAISDSFKERLNSAGGISLVNEDSKVISEVFGDAATDAKAAEATQEDVLTETGAIENMDTIKYPSLKIFEAAGTYSGQPLELKDIFPFCIPFDLYDMVTGLQAARCAPHFEWELAVPNVINYTFEIDFSSFDTVATLLRTLELLAFCVGLAFVTRSIIRG